MGMREILIAVMVLFIVGILADGFRRARRSRNNQIKMKIKVNRQPPVVDADELTEDFSNELPNGGARVIRPGQEARPAVPVLMDSVATEHDVAPAAQQEELFADEDHADSLDQKHVSGEGCATPDQAVDRETAAGEKQAREPSDVIIIHVLARKGEKFSGKQLLDELLSQGMRFGEMNIFHRYSQSSGKGELYFSMANAVEPGTFNIDTMENSETPGVSFFLQLPGPQESRAALETMIAITRHLADTLNAELKDENMSVVTLQTLEHYRHRVQEFERKRQLASA